ncbi:MAG TPA: ATP-binding protein [Bacteroidales bacterium]|nr:ATP-binding protein [Bacteroidales bacterium]
MNIAVASGKGGTGKTLVSTNLFHALQKRGVTVILVDCDAEEPNVMEFIQGETFASNVVTQNIPVIDTPKCTFCGKCYEYCNYNAILYLQPSKYIQVVEDLCHDCGACSVACLYGAITEKPKTVGKVDSVYLSCHSQLIEGCAEVGVYSPVPVIKRAIKEAQANTLNIFDSPPGISCPFIATVDKADYVILVTEPTPFGLNDLKLSIETLQQIGKPFGVVVNRSTLGNSDVYNYLEQNSFTLLMEIPFDKEIARIYSEGKMLVDEKPEYQERFIALYQLVKKQIQ